MRVVIDPNVLVSRFLSLTGPPAQVVSLLEDQRFQIVVSASILAEYRRALLYEHVAKRHGLHQSEVDQYLVKMQKLSLVVGAPSMSPIIEDDPDDDMFIACAIAGEADFIVSGDAHLLALGRYEGIEVLSPGAFLAMVSNI